MIAGVRKKTCRGGEKKEEREDGNPGEGWVRSTQKKKKLLLKGKGDRFWFRIGNKFARRGRLKK